MSGMAILEVAIGLTLLYLLLSLVCTIANEWIAQLLSLRARNLEMGIQRLLEDPDRSGLAGRLYGHPLLMSVCRIGQKPSYLPGSIFARALVDVLEVLVPGACQTISYSLSLRYSVRSPIPKVSAARGLLYPTQRSVSSINRLSTSSMLCPSPRRTSRAGSA